MKYPKEFKFLLNQMSMGYIGHGNPNAKILFIGQEPAIDRDIDAQDYKRDIACNVEQWKDIISTGTGYESVDNTKIEFGSPLHPWANQKYQVRSKLPNAIIRGKEGTSRTWYNYQKLINKIYEAYSNDRRPMTKDDYLDFHRLSFHTDMSAAAFKNHYRTDEGRSSVKERKALFSSDFFCDFPIVIAAVGHFPRDTYGNAFFEDIFEVEFIGNDETGSGMWMNVSLRDNENNPMLLIHTPQFGGAITDQYLDNMAKRIVDYAKEHQINLWPEG